MEAVAKSAIAKGLDGICFTDHLDLFEAKEVGKKCMHGYDAWKKGYEEIRQVRDLLGNSLEILHGMEIAEIPMDTERAEKFIASPDIDFVLGSIHMVKGYVDFYWMKFPDLAFCKSITEVYLNENIQLAKLGLVDSIAHIGYSERYMTRQGFFINLMDYEEQLRQLFSIMIQTGQGLEVNTSGLRQGIGCTFPNLSVLKLYKALGGEIITIGSDSHNAQDVGSHIQKVEKLLKELGFRYFTVFRQRKSCFIEL